MNWFFLSAFVDLLRNKEEPSNATAAKVTEISWKNTKFNELYVKDKSKTEKLYGKFVQTRAYKKFLNSSSLSTCFNKLL